MHKELKEKIKNWFLLTYGLDIQDIQDIQEFYHYYLLYPFGAILKNQDYKNQSIQTSLFLDNLKIEDISPLQNLINLTHLHLYENKIKKEQIEELKSHLPNCLIYSDFGHSK